MSYDRKYKLLEGSYMEKRNNTKQKIISTTKDLLEQQGAKATTLDSIVDASHAPRGSFYYYFKTGRAEIIEAAVKLATDEMEKVIITSFKGKKTAKEAVETFFLNWESYITKHQLKNGCAVVAVAVEGQSIELDLQKIVDESFGSWTNLLTKLLAQYNLDEKSATGLAETILAAGEGAIILSRAHQNIQSFKNVTNNIIKLL